METESGMKIKAIRVDRGSEYLSEDFQGVLKESGIQPRFTAACSLQQNGVFRTIEPYTNKSCQVYA